MSFVRSLRAALVSVLSVSSLVACGGGGGGPDPVCISFEQASLAGAFVQAQQKNVNADQDANSVVVFDATGPIDGQAYVYVVDTANVFDRFPVSVVALGTGRYELTLHANTGLPAGSYRGTLEVRLCKDVQCTKEYVVSEGLLPYAITIAPQLSVDVYRADAYLASATSATLQPVLVAGASNQRLRITSNVPMVVSFQNEPGSHEFVVDAASTPTDWRADVLVTPSGVQGTLVQVRAADSAATTERPVNVFVTF
jgi:hypothetical protein